MAQQQSQSQSQQGTSSPSAVTFVAGGPGTIGSGVIRSLLAQGHTVVTSSRQVDRLNALKQKFVDYKDKLVTIEGDVGNEEDAKRILQEVKQKFGKIDHFVASIGSWWQNGVLTKQSLAEFNKVMFNLAGAHFVAAKTFLPDMADQKNSSYTIISGSAGERVLTPDSTLTTVCASALFGISMALRHEFKDKEVRINEVRIGLQVLPQDKAEKKFQATNTDIGIAIAGIALDSDQKGQVISIKSQDDLGKLLAKYGKK